MPRRARHCGAKRRRLRTESAVDEHARAGDCRRGVSEAWKKPVGPGFLGVGLEELALIDMVQSTVEPQPSRSSAEEDKDSVGKQIQVIAGPSQNSHVSMTYLMQSWSHPDLGT
eukprot:997534-Rhodomonas_salina.2